MYVESHTNLLVDEVSLQLWRLTVESDKKARYKQNYIFVINRIIFLARKLFALTQLTLTLT